MISDTSVVDTNSQKYEAIMYYLDETTMLKISGHLTLLYLVILSVS